MTITPAEQQGLFLLLIMGFGVVIQSVLLLRNHIFSINYLACFLFPAMIAFLPSSRLDSYSVVFHFLMYILFVAGWIAITYQVFLHPRIDERVILLLVVSLAYLNFELFSETVNLGGIFLLSLLMIGIPMVVYLFIYKYTLSRRSKFGIYLWFLVTGVALGLFQAVALGNNIVNNIESPEYLLAFILGMVSLPIIANIIYLIGVIPYPVRRTQSMEARKEEVNENIDLMVSRISDYQMGASDLLTHLLLFGIPLIVNYVFSIVSPFLAIGIALLLVELAVYKRLSPVNLAVSALLTLLSKKQSIR